MKAATSNHPVPDLDVPLTEAEKKQARETGHPALMARTNHQKNAGRNDPAVPTTAAHQPKPPKADAMAKLMAEQMATLSATMAQLTGGVALTKEQILQAWSPRQHRSRLSLIRSRLTSLIRKKERNTSTPLLLMIYRLDAAGFRCNA